MVCAKRKDEAKLNSLIAVNMEEEDEDDDEEEFYEEQEEEEEDDDDEEVYEEREEEDDDEEEVYEEQEEKDDDEEEVYEEQEEEDDDEEEFYEEEDDDEDEEEKVINGRNAMVVVKNEELQTEKENVIKDDEKKAKQPKNIEKSGNMEEEKYEDEEECYEDEDEEADDEDEPEEETINNEGNEMIVVDHEELETDNKENAIKEDEKKTKEPENIEKSDNMKEEEDEDEEEFYEDKDEDEGEPAEEKINNGGNAMVVVKNEELETNKENNVKQDEKKAREHKNIKKSGEYPKSKEKKLNNYIKQDEQKESISRYKQPKSSNKKSRSKWVESMGMVFMCSSTTKKECLRRKILGLPESKKDQVLKIYEGMRLFLFDVDLRVIFGIFKAVGPGGYNIEPKAFNSKLPSQVRFSVVHDCKPLEERKFKHVIKENYYSRSKFEGLLNLDQVKKLCKLFVRVGRGRARSRFTFKGHRTKSVETRAQETRTRRARDEERRPRTRSRSRSPPVREKRRYTDYDNDRTRVLYDHEPLVSRYHSTLPPPAAIDSPVRLYVYERLPSDLPLYARDHLPEHHAYHVLDRDPYLVHHDTVYHGVPRPEYHLVSREYNHLSAIQTPEYGISRVASYRDVEIASDYRSSALALPEYGLKSRYRY